MAVRRAPLNLRSARPAEAAWLSALALRSKAHWGYAPGFIEACRRELSYTPSAIAQGGFVVAERDKTPIGFYALEGANAGTVELEALFVEPEWIGRGVGRALLDEAKRQARARGARRLIIQGDPHAARFYAAAGAAQIGTRPSGSIAGRELPLYVIELAPSEEEAMRSCHS